MKGHDLSKHQRLVYVKGPRVSGTFWVVGRTKPGQEVWVKAVDVTIFDSPERHSGRTLSSRDLTASVKDGVAHLRERSITPDLLADVQDVWDEMKEVLVAAAAVMDEVDQ